MKKAICTALSVVFLVLMIGIAPTQSVHAATTWTVTNTADTSTAVPGNCPHATNCRLRDAVAAASAGDTILFDASLSGQTIELVSTVTLSKDVTIDGSALDSPITISGVTTNDGSGNSRVFIIDSSIKANLQSLTITKSNITGYPYSGGIDVYNDAVLTITDCTISNNTGYANGGGILNWWGTVLITNSTVSNNTAISGAGIYSQGGTMTC